MTSISAQLGVGCAAQSVTHFDALPPCAARLLDLDGLLVISPLVHMAGEPYLDGLSGTLRGASLGARLGIFLRDDPHIDVDSFNVRTTVANG